MCSKLDKIGFLTPLPTDKKPSENPIFVRTSNANKKTLNNLCICDILFNIYSCYTSL